MNVFAIMLIAAGIISAAAPHLVYEITQSWKNINHNAPSDIYKILTRIQGVVLIIVGIAIIITN